MLLFVFMTVVLARKHGATFQFTEVEADSRRATLQLSTAHPDAPELTIHLEKSTGLFAADYEERMWIDGKPVVTDSSTWANHPSKHCHFEGYVEGHEFSMVRVSHCNGELSGLVIGNDLAIVVQHSENEHYVENFNEHMAENLPNQADEWQVLYRDPKAPSVDMDKRRNLQEETKYVEVLAVNDNSRYEAFSQDMETMGANTAAVFNLVTGYYRQTQQNGENFPYEIQVVLIGMETMTTEDPWHDSLNFNAQGSVQAESLLDSFHEWAVGQSEAGQLMSHDNRVLLSSTDFQGSTVGLAGVGTMCLFSDSGNVNQCTGDDATCAAIISHEMGHNFGMQHDSSGNTCPESGLIMNAVLSGSPPDLFSTCSVAYMEQYFSTTYNNRDCLDNVPSTVWGDPVCGNGFVEEGEDCDCGEDDCGVNSCCDGSTCTFADPSYQCDHDGGVCCESCMFIASSQNFVCRAQRDECDVPETCDGTSGDCPADVYDYPGTTCSKTEEDGSVYEGVCYAGTCRSVEGFCEVDVNRDYNPWEPTGYSSFCGRFNHDCGIMTCAVASTIGTSSQECDNGFTVEGSSFLTVPTGMNCQYPTETRGEFTGMCYDGECVLPHRVATYGICGNGGIDFGEECDCGEQEDPACDCATCTLLEGKVCASTDPCCNSDGTGYEPQGTVCREAYNDECDVAEVCTGDSAICPPDHGVSWENECAGGESTCYGKICMPTHDQECQWKTNNMDAYASNWLFGCNAISCCSNGMCSSSTVSSTITTGDTTYTYYFYAPLEGSRTNSANQRCIDYAQTDLLTDDSTCGENEFLDISMGDCFPCDSGCLGGCTGSRQFDCNECAFGERDSRGACAISQEQYDASPMVNTPDTGDNGGDPVVTPAPTIQTPAPTIQTPAPTIQTPAPTLQTPAPTMQTPPPTIETPAPTPQTSDDCDMTTIVVNGGDWSSEISFDIASCSFPADGEKYSVGSTVETCCIPYGANTLTCQDAFGDGWTGTNGKDNYLVINNKEYCREFESGNEFTEEVYILMPGETTTASPTQLVTHVCVGKTSGDDERCEGLNQSDCESEGVWWFSSGNCNYVAV